MDKQKSSLLDALVRLACAQADCIIRGDGDDGGEALPDVTLPELDATMQEIQKWADLNDSKVRHSFPGTCLWTVLLDLRKEPSTFWKTMRNNELRILFQFAEIFTCIVPFAACIIFADNLIF